MYVVKSFLYFERQRMSWGFIDKKYVAVLRAAYFLRCVCQSYWCCGCVDFLLLRKVSDVNARSESVVGSGISCIGPCSSGVLKAVV